MTVCKYDCLANPLAALHLQSVLHQVLQHLVYGVEVVDICKHLVVGNIPMVVITIQRLACLLILPYSLHLALLFLGEVAVLDTLFEYHCTTLEAYIVHEITI